MRFKKILGALLICIVLSSCQKTKNDLNVYYGKYDSKTNVDRISKYNDFMYEKYGKYLVVIDDNGVIYRLNQDLQGYSVCATNGNLESKSIEIKDSIEGIPVTTIEAQAFNSTKVQNIKLPKSVKYIKEGAFEYSSIKAIEGVENAIYVGDYAFCKCENLESIDLSGTKSIGYEALSQCTSLSNAVLPESLVYLGKDFAKGSLFFENNKIETDDYVCYNNYLIEVKSNNIPLIPDSITTETMYRFPNDSGTISYQKFRISENSKLKYFDTIHFANYKETTIINKTLAYAKPGDDLSKYDFDTIGAHALIDCENYTATENVKDIMPFAFDNSKYWAYFDFPWQTYEGITKSIDLSNASAEYIFPYTFHSNDTMNITIPKNTKNIFDSAFYGVDVESLNLNFSLIDENAINRTIGSINTNLYFIVNEEMYNSIITLNGENLALILNQNFVTNFSTINKNEYYCDVYIQESLDELKENINDELYICLLQKIKGTYYSL